LLESAPRGPIDTPVENDNIVEGVISLWNGINEDDWNGISADNWNGINLDSVEMPVENDNIVEVGDPNDMFEPRMSTRGVSQLSDGPFSDFYQTFVNNGIAMRRFEAAKVKFAEKLARDAAKARVAEKLARDVVNANDMFEPRTFTRVAEAQVVDVLSVKQT